MEINKLKQTSTIVNAASGSKYREVLSIVVKNVPKVINIGDWDKDGDMTFSVSMTDFGMTYKDYRAYENEVFSYFIVDFLGELIIRENLKIFADKLKSYGLDNYMTSLHESGGHKRFGILTQKGKLIFTFHVSLLKDILTEDFRERLGECSK